MLCLKAEHIKKAYGERILFAFDELCIYEGDKIALIGNNGCGKSTLLSIFDEACEYEGKITHYGTHCIFHQFEDVIKQKDKEMKEWQVLEKIDQNVMSGGEYTRLKLAQIFSEHAHLIMLDEPTAHLDMEGIELLKEKLRELKTFILISHDTSLLNDVCNKVIEIEEERIHVFQGSYDEYQAEKKRTMLKKQREYDAYVKEKQRLQDVYEQKRKKALEMTKRKKGISASEFKMRGKVALRRSFKGKEKSMMRQANSVKKHMEQMEVKEKPISQQILKLDYSLLKAPVSKHIAVGEHVNFAYGKHVILNDASFRIENKKRTAIIGANGCGKSTLIFLITQGYAGIRVAPNTKFAYLKQDLSNLDEHKSVLECAQEDCIQNQASLRSVLANLLFKEIDLKKRVGSLSGGEKMRLALAKLFVMDANVLILDEPGNYLDTNSLEALKQMLAQYQGTLILVTHDQSLIRASAQRLLFMKHHQIQTFEGTLDAYEQHRKKPSHHQETKMMLEMRLSQLTSIIAKNEAEVKAREEEIQSIINQLKQM